MAPHIEIIARGLVIAEEHVLLCRSLKAGYRYLPGGHVEFGESAAAALVREFREECGLAVTTAGLVFLSEEHFHDGKRSRHELNLVFPVRLGSVDPAGPARSNPSSEEAGGVFHVEHPMAGFVADAAGSPPSGGAEPPEVGVRQHSATGARSPEGVFHVEHPPAAIRLAVRSLEPKIAFDWVKLSDLSSAGLRPQSILNWLTTSYARGGR